MEEKLQKNPDPVTQRVRALAQDLVRLGMAPDTPEAASLIRRSLARIEQEQPHPQNRSGPSPGIMDPGSEQELSHQEERTAQICRYIREHFSERISTATLGEVFYLSASYISHLFKTQIGISPGRYLEEIRLFEAEVLLKNTDLPVGEVALRVGYRDGNYFSKCFRKRYGISPSAVRAQNCHHQA